MHGIIAWVFGLAWGFGFLGFWGPSTTLTAEVFPTRIRGVANGVVWFIGYFVGFVLWPVATVALQQATGSFALAFLTIPLFMAAMAVGFGLSSPSTPARSSTQSPSEHRDISRNVNERLGA